MKTWLRWPLLLMTIGGGFTGLALSVQAILQKGTGNFLESMILAAFADLYVFVVLGGLVFADNPKRTLPLIIGLCLQIPCFSSPYFLYVFSSGFRVNLGLISWNLWATLGLGSDAQFAILRNHPWGVGINVFAASMLVLVLITRRAAVAAATAPVGPSDAESADVPGVPPSLPPPGMEA
jgi:hypothetical protein